MICEYTYDAEGNRVLVTPTRHPLDTLSVHDLSAIRRIVGEVLADGYRCTESCELRHPWSFNSNDADIGHLGEDPNNEHRKQFLDAIEQRIIACAAPATVGGGQ